MTVISNLKKKRTFNFKFLKVSNWVIKSFTFILMISCLLLMNGFGYNGLFETFIVLIVVSFAIGIIGSKLDEPLYLHLIGDICTRSLLIFMAFFTILLFLQTKIIYDSTPKEIKRYNMIDSNEKLILYHDDNKPPFIVKLNSEIYWTLKDKLSSNRDIKTYYQYIAHVSPLHHIDIKSYNAIGYEFRTEKYDGFLNLIDRLFNDLTAGQITKNIYLVVDGKEYKLNKDSDSVKRELQDPNLKSIIEI